MTIFRGSLLLLLGIAIGLLVGWHYGIGAGRAAQRVEWGQIEGPERHVVVAAQDLSTGTTITREMIASRAERMRYLPDGIFLRTDYDQLLGKTLNVPVTKGQMILRNDLEQASE